MPLYEFVCQNKHVTEARAKMDLSDAPQACEHPHPLNPDAKCAEPLVRILSRPAGMFPGADSWRK